MMMLIVTTMTEGAALENANDVRVGLANVSCVLGRSDQYFVKWFSCAFGCKTALRVGL